MRALPSSALGAPRPTHSPSARRALLHLCGAPAAVATQNQTQLAASARDTSSTAQMPAPRSRRIATEDCESRSPPLTDDGMCTPSAKLPLFAFLRRMFTDEVSRRARALTPVGSTMVSACAPRAQKACSHPDVQHVRLQAAVWTSPRAERVGWTTATPRTRAEASACRAPSCRPRPPSLGGFCRLSRDGSREARAGTSQRTSHRLSLSQR